MLQQYFEVELLDDVVLSESNATTGLHRTLTYIPGNNWLGVAARQCYPQFRQESSQTAWTVFHSGAVRFGNAFPLTGDQRIGYPMPYCLHNCSDSQPHADTSKEIASVSRGEKGACGESQRVINLSGHGDFSFHKPLKQRRTGYLSASNEVVTPVTTYRMKTAIDSDTSTAADNQLFGYQSLCRGQRFIFSLDADPSAVIQGYFGRLVESLCGEHTIGRSRSAEYGRVRVSLVDGDVAVVQSCQPGKTGDLEKGWLIWVISDLALENNRGNAVLLPSPEALGLPPGRLELSRSFIRQRCYAPFNGRRQAFARERQVISAGSVLCYHGESAPTAEQLSRLDAGIGLYREEGLGRVLVSPSLLSATELVLTDVSAFPCGDVDSARGGQQTKPPQSPLIHWLTQRCDDAITYADVDQLVDSLYEELKAFHFQARSYKGVFRDEALGPGRSQWGNVLQVADRCRNDSRSLDALLFGDGEKDGQRGVICHQQDRDWNMERVIDGKIQTLSKWLREVIQERTNHHDPGLIIALLAKRTLTQAWEDIRRGIEPKGVNDRERFR